MKRNMIKRAISCIICFVFMLTFSATVFANETDKPIDPSVSYSAGANEFTFYPTSKDLFQNFKGIMPGDNLKQTFSVENASNSGIRVDLYLRAKPFNETYPKSSETASSEIEEIDKINDFLKQLTLAVEYEGKPPFSTAPANEQGGLVKDVFLGSFSPGSKTNLVVTLTVPIEMSDEFQDMTGKITWVFKAEEKPYYPPTTDPDPDPDPDKNDDVVIIEDDLTPLGDGGISTTGKVKSPVTGDSANIFLPIVLMAVTGLIIVLLFVTRKGKRKDR